MAAQSKVPPKRGIILANPGWAALMLVAATLANVRFGESDSRQVGWAWSPLTLVFVVLALIPVFLPGRTVGSTKRREGAPSALSGWAWVIGALLSLAVGLWVYNQRAPALDVIAVELGGAEQELPQADLSAALSWDFALIVGYGTALWMATTTATWVFWTPRAAHLARLARWLTVMAVLSDMAENICLGVAWTRPGSRGIFLDLAAVLATVKFSVLLPATLVAVVGVIVVVARLFSSFSGRRRREREDERWGWSRQDKLVTPAPRTLVGIGAPAEKRKNLSAAAREEMTSVKVASLPEEPSVVPSADQRWKAAYNVPGITPESLRSSTRAGNAPSRCARWGRNRAATTEPRPSDRIGFCLSGGGVRSASLAMGFLQSMRKELRRARYIVSVSGGGYTSGALVQALTGGVAPPGAPGHLAAPRQVIRDADTVYMPGTVEFDHLRRHSSYISATVPEMFFALAVLARGLIASLFVLFAPAIAIGVFLAWMYHFLPVSVLPTWSEEATETSTGVPATTALETGLSLPAADGYAVLAVGVVALLLWLLKIMSQDAKSSAGRWLHGHAQMGANFTALAGLVVAIIAVGVPSLMWATRWLGEQINVTVGVSASVGGVVLSYVASLAALLWRRRTQLSDVLAGDGKKKSKTAVVPQGLLQLLLVITALSVLCALWLLLLGSAALAEASVIVEGTNASSVRLGVAILLLVFVIGAVFDQSSLSLHPFYRGRLASAFATRRVKMGPDAPPVAVPYDPQEGTTLSTHGVAKPDDGKPYPQVIFAAAANLTGEHRTPSGLSAVSFVMSADWCGGPDVGWIDTATLEKLSPRRLQHDLTVQAAVAISGAAFASAMGRFARWYQLLLAVTGARLGAWLPNPTFIAQMRDVRREGRIRDWTLPALPRVRRLSYLLREVFNIHPAGDRLLQVTDGGHYENLGLVELLRRRCTTIYCVDGGGDHPPTAPGLAEAMALAKAELGITITLDNAWDTEPGSGSAIEPAEPLRSLNATLSKTAIITGTITYPEASGLPEGRRTGRLFVARALLTPDMPYDLLSYAAQHPEFPHDSTSDQWFEDGKFTAYAELGRYLGTKTLKARPPDGPAG